MTLRFSAYSVNSGHSGAKFDDESYVSVRGLNGIGSGATGYYLISLLLSQRDGYSWSLDFKDGIPKLKPLFVGFKLPRLELQLLSTQAKKFLLLKK